MPVCAKLLGQSLMGKLLYYRSNDVFQGNGGNKGRPGEPGRTGEPVSIGSP